MYAGVRKEGSRGKEEDGKNAHVAVDACHSRDLGRFLWGLCVLSRRPKAVCIRRLPSYMYLGARKRS